MISKVNRLVFKIIRHIFDIPFFMLLQCDRYFIFQEYFLGREQFGSRPGQHLVFPIHILITS